jgi:hypothetical protein
MAGDPVAPAPTEERVIAFVVYPGMITGRVRRA